MPIVPVRHIIEGGTASCDFHWNGFNWQWNFTTGEWEAVFYAANYVTQPKPPPFRLERIEKEEQTK